MPFGDVYAGLKKRTPDTGGNAYLSALQKAAYGDAGAQYGQGLNDITNFLARSGPLADSGAGTALKYKLASSIYGGANRDINRNYADFLRQMIAQSQAYRYQMALAKYQKDSQRTGIGGVLGGIVGGFGGPFLGALGAGLGSRLGGKSSYGGYQASDAYYG